jgi:uncharacterized repeat protein (TIGR02543 family)
VRDHAGYGDAFAAKLNSTGGLTWNTFLGGSGYDTGKGIAVDGSGNVYVTGDSEATWGSPVRVYTGNSDAFIAKLISTGGLTWSTFLGGQYNDYGNGIAIDGSGNVYVTGYSAASWGSPVRAYASSGDAFAAGLNSSGGLTWNTFLGGSGTDEGYGIVVDGNGNVYVTGASYASWGSPVRAFISGSDAFVAKIDSSGGLTWNTFLGGSGGDAGRGITVDGSGNVHVTGDSEASWGSPVRAFSSSRDAFAAKLNSTGGLTWNTFLGGSGYDTGKGIAIDGSGNVYVTGESSVTWDSPVRAYTGGTDAFVAKIPAASLPTYRIYLPVIVKTAPQPCYSLTTTVSPAGGGIVTPSSGGNCGDKYYSGTSVNLTATPNSGYIFSGWSGDITGSSNPASVTMDSDKTITANFSIAPPACYLLTMNTNGPCLAVLTHYTNSPSCSQFHTYTAGDKIDLTTMGWNPGCYVVSWSGTDNDSSTGANNTVTMPARDHTVTVNTALKPCYSLSTTVTPNVAGIVAASISKNCGDKYYSGISVNLTATPNSGWIFSSWSGAITSTSNPITVTMDSDKSITANFYPIESMHCGGYPTTVVVLVDTEFAFSVRPGLSQFEHDLCLDGYNVYERASNFNSPPEVRSYLANLYARVDHPLEGAIFIGDIPRAYQWITDLPPAEEVISYQYYSDLDGIFSVSPNYVSPGNHAYSYDIHSGAMNWEIWTSILPYYKGSTTETVNALNRYFAKNHSYRTGGSKPPRAFLQISELNTASTQAEQDQLISGFKNGLYSWTPFSNAPNARIYLNGPTLSVSQGYADLKAGMADFTVTDTHGWWGASGQIDIAWVENNPVNTVFFWGGGCAIGDIDHLDNFLSSIVYSPTSKVLIGKGTTNNSGGMGNNQNGFYGRNIATALSQGKNFGQAILSHVNVPLVYPYSDSREFHFATVIIVGDPTLKLRP